MSRQIGKAEDKLVVKRTRTKAEHNQLLRGILIAGAACIVSVIQDEKLAPDIRIRLSEISIELAGICNDITGDVV